MLFTIFGTTVSIFIGGWFVYRYQNEDRPYSNEELTIMSQRLKNEDRAFHRAQKTVISIEEYRRLDPTFIPPSIPTFGEPDI